MPPLDDDTLIEQLRREGVEAPAISYLQRRFRLPYQRAAALREKFVSTTSAAADSDADEATPVPGLAAAER